MNRLLFIVNPMAGGGRARSLEPLITKTMEEYKIEYDLVFTSREGDGAKLAEESCCNRVIAVGGDGTVNEVAKGLLKRGYGVMGIIPSGTGNDLSRSLGIPLDPLKAIEFVINGKTRFIDVGVANGNYFLNIASFGFDAEVVINSHRFKRLYRGKIAYILGIILTLIKFKKREITLEIDGKEYRESLILLAIGNGKYYGGGMKILPDSNLDDGYLHLCLIKDASNLLLLILFPTIFSGKHLRYSRYVNIFKAKNVKIRSNSLEIFNIDGEIIHGENEIIFNISDHKLPIMCI
ncbi:MAG: diacylglycerol kinase family protein [Tissierellaceae bacterium]